MSSKADSDGTVAIVVALFVAAGLFEIGGGWLIWQHQREEKPWWYALLGAIALVLYGFVPTWQPLDAGNFGRVYA
jgi:small multidrug resistance family-3 protein